MFGTTPTLRVLSSPRPASPHLPLPPRPLHHVPAPPDRVSSTILHRHLPPLAPPPSTIARIASFATPTSLNSLPPNPLPTYLHLPIHYSLPTLCVHVHPLPPSITASYPPLNALGETRVVFLLFDRSFVFPCSRLFAHRSSRYALSLSFCMCVCVCVCVSFSWLKVERSVGIAAAITITR